MITEHDIEEELRRTQRRLAVATRAARLVTWEWTIATNAVEWGEGVHTILGYEPTEVGATIDWWYEHIHPDDRDRIRANLNASIERGDNRWSEEYRFERANGNHVIVRDTADIERDASGHPTRTAAAMQVTVGQRRVEAALRETGDAERELRQLAQAIAEAPDVANLMTHVVEGARSIANAAGAFMEGMIEKEQVEVLATTGEGTPMKGERFAYPGSLTEEILKNREPVFLLKMQGIGVAMASYVERHCDGCSALIVPVFGATTPLGALVLLRRPGEAQFATAVVDWIRTVAELASIAMQRIATLAESERGREVAEAAVRSRDDVLAVVSHDLRNPVNTIVMSASLLSDEEFDLEAGQRDKQLEIITRSARRMDQLIQDLLDVTQIESGRLTMRFRCEDPTAIGRELCEAFHGVADEKSLHFSCDLRGDFHKVHVDRDRVLQALSNYLSNAIKFTAREGKVALVAAPIDGGGVRFSIADTGPGIASDQLPHIFDRYWQGRGTAHLGAGLGLSITNGIAKAHRGRAWAESKVGAGSTFYLEIPGSTECA
jgi:signal transduction histidine kinase